jgi:hypothetical protein
MIKDWWYAIKVCRKYKITWNPFRKLDNASYGVWWDGDGKITRTVIHMSPFFPKFIETFMHEVGHITLYKRGTAQKLYMAAKSNLKYEKESIWFGGKLLLPLLVEESLASRFSRKSLKGKADVRDLTRAFQTYSAVGYRQLLKSTPEDADTIVRLTKFVENGIRRIEK